MSEEDLEFGFKHNKSDYLPNFVQFESGTKCNTSCVMCPHSKMKRSGWATWKTLIEVIEEAAPFATTVCPFLMQEPLLEPRLIPILNNLRYTTPSTKVTVYTNMAAMTEELARQILETRAVNKLCISFYGPTEEVYSRWQPGLDWETTKENIRRFMKIRDEMGLKKPVVFLHIIGATELLDHLLEFTKEWINVVDEIAFVYYDTFCGEVPWLGSPGFVFKDYIEPKERAPCQRLWGTMTVLFNGDMVPCCLDYQGSTPLGNVNKEHVHDIWRGEKYNELRRLHLERRFDEIPLCKNCIVWTTPSDEIWQRKWEKPQN